MPRREAGSNQETTRVRGKYWAQVARGSQSERTPCSLGAHGRMHAIAVVTMNKPNGWSRRLDTGLPKREGSGASGQLSDWYPSHRNPADSATLPLRKTNIRNVVTTLVLSRWSVKEKGDVPNRMHKEWWDGPRSQCLGQ
jgi:hypothetical protein